MRGAAILRSRNFNLVNVEGSYQTIVLARISQF